VPARNHSCPMAPGAHSKKGCPLGPPPSSRWLSLSLFSHTNPRIQTRRVHIPTPRAIGEYLCFAVHRRQTQVTITLYCILCFFPRPLLCAHVLLPVFRVVWSDAAAFASSRCCACSWCCSSPAPAPAPPALESTAVHSQRVFRPSLANSFVAQCRLQYRQHRRQFAIKNTFKVCIAP
jgi:hypothetical protein